MRISWEQPATGVLLTHILGCLGFSEAEGQEEVPIDLDFVGEAPSQVPGAVRIADYDYGISAFRSETQILLSNGRSTVLIFPSGGSAKAYLDPETQEHPDAVRVATTLLVIGLLVLLRYRQAFPLHAAMLTRVDAGVLFAGPSGSGKSTMAYSLVRQGWGYLSDDTILLRPGGRVIEAFPFRRNFGLHEFGVVPITDGIIHGDSLDESKRLISMEQSFPGQAVSRSIPRVIIFPEIVNRSVSTLVAVEKREVMHRLMSQSALLMLEPKLARGHLDVLSQLISQTNHYRLLAGRDLEDDPLLIEPLIEQALEKHTSFAV